jgi:hypothetical protein
MVIGQIHAPAALTQRKGPLANTTSGEFLNQLKIKDFFSKKTVRHEVKTLMNAKDAERRTVTYLRIRECIQNFPDWPPGAKTANVTALCH